MREEERSLDSGAGLKRDADRVHSLSVLIPDAWLGPGLSLLRNDRSRDAGMTEILERATGLTSSLRVYRPINNLIATALVVATSRGRMIHVPCFKAVCDPTHAPIICPHAIGNPTAKFT